MCVYGLGGQQDNEEQRLGGGQGRDDCYDFNREIKIEADRDGKRVHPPIIIATS